MNNFGHVLNSTPHSILGTKFTSAREPFLIQKFHNQFNKKCRSGNTRAYSKCISGYVILRRQLEKSVLELVLTTEGKVINFKTDFSSVYAKIPCEAEGTVQCARQGGQCRRLCSTRNAS